MMQRCARAKVQDLKGEQGPAMSGSSRRRRSATAFHSLGAAPFPCGRPKMRVFFDVRRFENRHRQRRQCLAELGFRHGARRLSRARLRGLFPERMVCVMRRTIPSRKGHDFPGDLKNVPFIALEHGTKMGTIVRQAFSEAGEPSPLAVEVRYCNTPACWPKAARGRGGRSALAVVLRPLQSGVRAFERPAKSFGLRRPLAQAAFVTAAEAFLREVRVVVGEVAEEAGLNCPFVERRRKQIDKDDDVNDQHGRYIDHAR